MRARAVGAGIAGGLLAGATVGAVEALASWFGAHGTGDLPPVTWALLVYGLWGWLIWRSDLSRPVRVTAAPLLALWGCGVVWSRLALGAHYVTDLIGGMLLGATTLSLAFAVREALRARTRA